MSELDLIVLAFGAAVLFVAVNASTVEALVRHLIYTYRAARRKP